MAARNFPSGLMETASPTSGLNGLTPHGPGRTSFSSPVPASHTFARKFVPVVTTVLPSSRSPTRSPAFSIAMSVRPVLASQSLTEPWTVLNARIFPSAENPPNAVTSLIVKRSRRVARSQTFKVLSKLREANRSPPGLKKADRTKFVCPRKVSTSSPRERRQSRRHSKPRRSVSLGPGRWASI